jgi:hypothetical protein
MSGESDWLIGSRLDAFDYCSLMYVASEKTVDGRHSVEVTFDHKLLVAKIHCQQIHNDYHEARVDSYCEGTETITVSVLV